MMSLSLDPIVLTVAVVAAGLYLWGVVRVSSWRLRNTVAFLLLGVGSLVAVGAYAPARFSVYAVELMVLLLGVPFLMALGRPLELALEALPARAAALLRAVLGSRPARLVTQPIAGPLLLAVLPFGVLFTAVLPETLDHPIALSALRVVLLVAGVVVLVPLWESQSLDTRIPYALALLIAFIELLADALPGIIVRLDTRVLAAGHFLGAHPLRDQQIGGDLLWGFGEVIDLPFLVLLLVQWARSDTRDAMQIDAELDARPAPPSEVAEAAEVPRTTREPVYDRPWWETDASVFGDRAHLYGEKSEG